MVACKYNYMRGSECTYMNKPVAYTYLPLLQNGRTHGRQTTVVWPCNIDVCM